MYLPSLPSMAASLHASAGLVKMSLTAFLLIFALLQIIYGPLSDRFGRRAPILAGLSIYVAGSLLCATATTVLILIVSHVVQELGAAAGPALGRAIARDVYNGPQLTSSLAIIAAAVALSPMLGPVAGGYLQTSFGWHATFYVLSIGGAILLLATFLLLPETNAQRNAGGLKPATIGQTYLLLLTDSEYMSSLLCGGLLTAGNFAWTAIAPFLFAIRYGLNAAQYGNVALFVGGGYLFGTFLCGRLSSRITAPVLVYAGLACALAGSVSLSLLSFGDVGYWPIIGTMMLFTMGMGVAIPMSAAAHCLFIRILPARLPVFSALYRSSLAHSELSSPASFAKDRLALLLIYWCSSRLPRFLLDTSP
jgi:DHA1 family bicyclomycin/chloramphenicol resistance-like MFS transporter